MRLQNRANNSPARQDLRIETLKTQPSRSARYWLSKHHALALATPGSWQQKISIMPNTWNQNGVNKSTLGEDRRSITINENTAVMCRLWLEKCDEMDLGMSCCIFCVSWLLILDKMFCCRVSRKERPRLLDEAADLNMPETCCARGILERVFLNFSEPLFAIIADRFFSNTSIWEPI